MASLIKNKHLHDWNVSPKQAVELQKQLAPLVEREDRFARLRQVAGVDVGFEEGGEITRAAIAVLDYQSLELVEVAVARTPTVFPYVPGLLSFREIPAILQALQKLQTKPDMLLCDGQGLAHPRRFGIACHLGVVTDLPAIGVGKSRLVGQHDDLPEPKGAWVPLMHKSEVVGAVLRSRQGVKPIYVSTGHRVSLASAIDIVMHCITRYKLPETTRMAHKYASVLR